MPRAKRRPQDPNAQENRGGVRQGQQGTAYAQRTDLNANRAGSQPVTTATGQPYGQAAAQAASQRVVPLAGTPAPAAPAPGAAPSIFASGFPEGYVGPGEVTPLHAPTERPGEPVTHGLTNGPGGGPEVLPAFAAPAAQNLGDLLTRLAGAPGSTPDVAYLRAYVDSGRR